MKLAPKDPPDQSTRCARGFAAEIGLLRAQGYTFEAIRQALAETGMAVSKSIVQREVARLASGSSTGSVTASEPSISAPEAASAPFPGEPDPANGQLSGKEVTEALINTRNTNPLFRQRSTE